MLKRILAFFKDNAMHVETPADLQQPSIAGSRHRHRRYDRNKPPRFDTGYHAIIKRAGCNNIFENSWLQPLLRPCGYCSGGAARRLLLSVSVPHKNS
jgi:hypothetical protein